jgi:hypothetical protein
MSSLDMVLGMFCQYPSVAAINIRYQSFGKYLKSQSYRTIPTSPCAYFRNKCLFWPLLDHFAR